LGLESAGLSYIAEGCPKLERLYLNSCSLIEDEGLIKLCSACPGLRSLDLCYCWKLTEKSIKQLAQLSHLEELILTECSQITDEALVPVMQGCQKLLVLDLSQTAATDNLISCLPPSLQVLHLSGINITDVGLQSIADRLTSLCVLDLSKCVLITDRGVSAVRYWLPCVQLNLYGCMKVKEYGEKYFSQFVGLGQQRITVPDIYTALNPSPKTDG